MATVPPTRVPLPPKPVSAPADTAPTAPTIAAKPAKAAKAAPKAAPVAVAKPVVKAKPVAAPVAKAVSKPAAKTTKAAVENVVPKVPSIKGGKWGDEAIELGMLMVEMKKVTPAYPKTGPAELRNVGPRLQVHLNAKHGIVCKKCYSQVNDLKAIHKELVRVPVELRPAKWVAGLDRLRDALLVDKKV